MSWCFSRSYLSTCIYGPRQVFLQVFEHFVRVFGLFAVSRAGYVLNMKCVSRVYSRNREVSSAGDISFPCLLMDSHGNYNKIKKVKDKCKAAVPPLDFALYHPPSLLCWEKLQSPLSLFFLCLYLYIHR